MSKPTKAQNPDMDFGFYAGIPRVVRTGYKDVSPVQKWLYVCLKDLAGDDGTCYRTIRSLVEETGLSAGMISESILVLHKAGLIHAEKKKRSTGGKEVWHISIVDIWKKNGEVHPTKRSQDEQSTSYKNVHDMNIHHTNNNSPVCSPTEHKRSQDEQECSRGETEERTISRPVSKNITEEKQSTYGAPVETAASGTDVPPRALSSQSDLSTKATSEQDNVATAQLSTLTVDKPRQDSAKVEPKAKQDALIQRPSQPEMPLQTARWCAETAVLVSEALRGKYYTEQQRTNQVNAARRMFKDFKSITRAQFEEIFTDWAKWWRDHDKGFFTLADLLARGQNREVRLQTALDKLEARKTAAKPKPQQAAAPKPSNPYDLVTLMASRPVPTNGAIV